MIKKWLWGLIFIDFVLILLHVFWGENIYILNLDHERTIPSYYSGLKLASIAMLSFLVFLLFREKNKIFKKEVCVWFLLSLFFIFLSFDEISELHENLGNYFLGLSNNFNIFQQDSFMWLIFLSPIIFIVLFLLINFLILIKKSKSFIFVLLGIISFFLVLVFEFIGGMIIKSSPDWYSFFIVAEEMMEKIGATLFFVGILRIFKIKFSEAYIKIK